jgi:RHS repeat-associated protein
MAGSFKVAGRAIREARRFRHGTRGGPSPLTYSANATTNRLDSVTGGLTRTYTYNTKGQVEHDGTRDFVWNGADRIVEVVGIASYAYDALGKRIKTTKASGAVEYTIYSRAGTLLYSYKPALSESTDYVYLGSMALAELRMAPGVLSNTDSRNPVETVQVTLVPGRSPQVGGPVTAQVETTYLHTNLLGSPIQWSSRAATGVWLNSEHYEAYGHKLNGVGDKLGYTGHAHDFETDLTYMQARFYDPQVGRFMSADPVEFGGGDPSNVNRYRYAANNPYKYTDPTGMLDSQMTVGGSKVVVVGSMPGRGSSDKKDSGGKSPGDPKTARLQEGRTDRADNAVREMISDGQVPAPVDDVLDRYTVNYNQEQAYDDKGQPLEGLWTPVPPDGYSATVTVYPAGATTLKNAIETIGHEIFHFADNSGKKWEHPKHHNLYGEALYKVFQGQPYNGPRP